jgi:hypothetical protein
MRGRNNRKGPNPLTRTYESNGPDVKIRGTAQHIAEKYLQLARDAQSSGDPVVAESFLQHAEHYFRIIASAQAAQQQAQIGYGRNPDDVEDMEDDDDFVAIPDRFSSPFDRASQNPALNQPQPNVTAMGFSGAQQPYFERPLFAPESSERPAERNERSGDRNGNVGGNRMDRQARNERRFAQQEDHQPNPGRRHFRDQQSRLDANASSQEQPRVDFETANPGLPAFITSPTRLPPASPSSNPGESVEARALESNGFEIQSQGNENQAGFPPTDNPDETEARFHLRPRRRRRVRVESAADQEAPGTIAETNSAE